MSIWLGYVKRYHEIEVAEALQADGIDVWCGRVVEWIRQGKRRRPDPIINPALPNFIFVDVPPEMFYFPRPRYMAQTMLLLSPAQSDGREGYWKTREDGENVWVPPVWGYRQYRRKIDEAFAADMRVVESRQRPKTEFTAGQRVRITAGPFADALATFRRVREGADGFERLVVEADVLGRVVPVEVDPLSVKRAG